LKDEHVLTDITLKLVDRSTISCHKLVLMIASPFFEAMFKSAMKESTQQEVQLDFFDAVTTRMLVAYFYSGKIEINTENAERLVEASDFLCMSELKQDIGASLIPHVDSTNCMEIYQFACKYSLEQLISHCLELILANFNEVARSSDAFVQLSLEELIRLLSFGGKIGEVYCAEVMSLDQGEWKPEPTNMIQPCSKPYIVQFKTKLYVLGGINEHGPSLYNQEFDCVCGTWRLKTDMPGVCQSGAAVSLNDNIFVVGGTEQACFRYTPATDAWTVLSQ
ncbi:hypothetical protein CAPTEDRAFT_64340, partial [Capitella teleta]